MTQEEYYLQHTNCPNCIDGDYSTTDMLVKFTGDDDFIDNNRVTCTCGWKGLVHDLIPDKKTIEDGLSKPHKNYFTETDGVINTCIPSSKNKPQIDLSKLTYNELQSLQLAIQNELNDFKNRDKIEVYFCFISFEGEEIFKTYDDFYQYLLTRLSYDSFNYSCKEYKIGKKFIDKTLYFDYFGE